MAIVFVDGKEIELAEGERLNGIEIAARAGVEIPHYCWHPGLSVVASCRMCLVETGRRDSESGEISMVPKLVPACQTPAADGTVFVTGSEKVIKARAMVEEDLLINHPIDCPICDKAGECHLQDYHFQHGQPQRRADLRPFTSRRRPMGDSVTLFVDRCVMCTRCVRFTREVTGTNELMVVNRGSHEEIDVFPGYPLENKMAGNVVDLCPVGALGDIDFLYQQRVWFMKQHEGVCAGCSTGCSITIEENQSQIYRLKPRENKHVNQWWMCDEGRYGFKHVHSSKRLTQPRRREGQEYVDIEWSELIEEIDQKLRRAGRLAAVISPHLTVEEAYLFAKYIRQLDSEALLALGPIPRQGEEETFPNGFTIHAEKCPNRRGVEEIVRSVGGSFLTWDDLCEKVAAGEIEALWITGGYKNDWTVSTEMGPTEMGPTEMGPTEMGPTEMGPTEMGPTEMGPTEMGPTEMGPTETGAVDIDSIASVPLLIVQDIFSSPLWKQATYQLPGAAFAEREGSYVNHADRLQSFSWTVRPPAGVQTEGQIFWRLLKKAGMYNARRVLDEIAQEIDFFAAAAESVSKQGVQLTGKQLTAV